MRKPAQEPKEIEKGVGIPTYTKPPEADIIEQEPEENSDE